MSVLDTPTDAKAGLSSYCRQGNHSTCRSVKARCACSCHGKPQRQEPPMPVQPLRTVRDDTPDGMVWEDPPEMTRGPRKVDWSPVLAALRSQPGHWARIASRKAKSGGFTVAKQLRETYPGYEFAARRTDGGSAVWGRYTGAGK